MTFSYLVIQIHYAPSALPGARNEIDDIMSQPSIMTESCCPNPTIVGLATAEALEAAYHNASAHGHGENFVVCAFAMHSCVVHRWFWSIVMLRCW